jgi:probable F420-dependent oxidoreductase
MSARHRSVRQSTPSRPLKIGLFLPFFEGMMNGETPRWTDLQTMSRLAEDLGFDSLWFGDHMFLRGARGPAGCWECWSLLAAVAASTSRIEFGPLVSPIGFRNPALLAKMADTVDEISGGRLVLGLGAGWHEAEYHAFGFPFDHRASRFEEAIAIIHGLLREGQVDFAGKYYQARDCELRPRGPRPNGPPIMIGTRRPRMLRLAARYADIWNTDWVLPEALTSQQADVDAACADVGRDPTTLERTASVRIHLPEAETNPVNFTAQISGSPAEVAAAIHAYVPAGITHLQVWLSPSTPAGIEAFAPVLDILDQG